MTEDNDPQPLSYYAKSLRGIVPKEALKPATYKLIPMFIHALLFVAYIFLVAYFGNIFALIGFSVLAGITIACLFLYAHELSHGVIIKKQPYLYLLQNFFWAFSGIPPTLWQKIHNLTHHKHSNTYTDPDRKTFKSEAGVLNNLYNLFIYPNKKLRYSFTVGFAMILYSTKHILSVYYTRGKKPSIVTYRPEYSKSEIRAISFELGFIILFWAAIWYSLGFTYGLTFSLISWTVYSAFVILFIITQHQRDPVFIEIADPLLTTTSVIVPKWIDRIIDWHSFHVEHHLFPGINFDYYPMISEKIKEKFPDRYERIPLFQAVKEAYNEDVLIDDPLM